MADGELPPGYAADDGAALRVRGDAAARVRRLDGRARGCVRYEPDGHGGVIETELAMRVLPEADRGARRSDDLGDVSELRALRAGRHRWD